MRKKQHQKWEYKVVPLNECTAYYRGDDPSKDTACECRDTKSAQHHASVLNTYAKEGWELMFVRWIYDDELFAYMKRRAFRVPK